MAIDIICWKYLKNKSKEEWKHQVGAKRWILYVRFWLWLKRRRSKMDQHTEITKKNTNNNNDQKVRTNYESR